MRKNGLDRVTLYRTAVLAMLLFCVYLAVHEIWGDNGYLAYRRQQRQHNEIQQKNQELQRQNQQLEKEIKALETDPQAIEKRAREELHLAKPAELIVTLPPKQAGHETSPPAGTPAEPPASQQGQPCLDSKSKPADSKPADCKKTPNP